MIATSRKARSHRLALTAWERAAAASNVLSVLVRPVMLNCFAPSGTHESAFVWQDKGGVWQQAYAAKTCPFGSIGDTLVGLEPTVVDEDGCVHFPDMFWGKTVAMQRAAEMQPQQARYRWPITSVGVKRCTDITTAEALASGVHLSARWCPGELDSRPFEEKWWDDFTFWDKYPQMVLEQLWSSRRFTWATGFAWVLTVENGKAAPTTRGRPCKTSPT